MRLRVILLWLLVGNLSYQCLGKHDWLEALDHTYWEAIALIVVWVASTMRSVSLASQQRRDAE